MAALAGQLVINDDGGDQDAAADIQVQSRWSYSKWEMEEVYG